MPTAKIFISNLKLNTYAIDALNILKIYFNPSQIGLALASGNFSYTDANGQMQNLPIIDIDDGLIFVNLATSTAYSGTLNLKFQTGETLTQTIGFALMPWLNEFSLSFTPNVSETTFSGAISLKVDPDQMLKIDHYELNSSLLSAHSLALTPDASKAFFVEISPNSSANLEITRIDKDGSAYKTKFQIFIPTLTLINDAANTPNLGYQHSITANALEETHNIPFTQNIIPHEANWLTHNPETTSLSDTSPLSVKTAISPDTQQYLSQHELNQHNNYLDYGAIRAQGFSAGPATDVTWDKSHTGRHTLSHQGNFKQDRSVISASTTINSPKINYQHTERSTTFTGDTMIHSSLNSNEITQNEQSIVGNSIEASPQMQETIDTTTEAYQSQIKNFSDYSELAADQFSFNMPTFIKCDRFDLADCPPGAMPGLAFLQIPTYNITIDIASALCMTVAPSGLICLIKFSMTGNVSASKPSDPVYSNDPATLTMGDEAKAQFAKLITSMTITEIGSKEKSDGPPVDTSLEIVSVTLSLANGETFSCSLSMSAPNICTIDNETLNFDGSYEGWEFEGSTDFSADIIFVGWNDVAGKVTVAKPSALIAPYPYQMKARQLTHLAYSFLQTDVGKQALGAAMSAAGDPYLPVLKSLHEHIESYGIKNTLKQIALTDAIILSSSLLSPALEGYVAQVGIGTFLSTALLKMIPTQ